MIEFTKYIVAFLKVQLVFKSTLSAVVSSDSGGILSLVCHGKFVPQKHIKISYVKNTFQRLKKSSLLVQNELYNSKFLQKPYVSYNKL